jgi:hypothetical protein
MDDEFSLELTPAEAVALSALIDQCLKILKESNERSERVYAELAQSRAETQLIIQEVKRMLKMEETP